MYVNLIFVSLAFYLSGSILSLISHVMYIRI